MLSSIDGNAIYIKSQEGYAEYYNEFGWFGTLENMDNVSMYKLNMDLEGNIILSGMPVDVASTVFNLAAGWNWIGYSPQLSSPVDQALGNIPEGNASYLKSQEGYAEFYNEFGWFGTLENMDPFLGYQLNMTTATDFVYNDVTGGMAAMHTYDIEQPTVYDINVHDFEFNGSVTAALYKDGIRIDSDDYVLAAFDGNECVGYTEELSLPYQLSSRTNGTTVYPLMVYSNSVENSLKYEVYEKSTGLYYDVLTTLPFTQDMSHGDALEPIGMELSRQAFNHKISAPYPNPFNPVVSFDITLDGFSHVDARIYDIQGREVAVVNDGMINSQTLSWVASDYASGIYFLKVVVDGQQAQFEKVVLLK
tara:strand:- start:79 stop:1167 length:1089 start_codon:yes stop_codon:yes gene_type:complete